MDTEPWTEEEDDILRKHYPTHGRNWDGWETLLPWRTPNAIGARASRIGYVRVRLGPRDKSRKIAKKVDKASRDQSIEVGPDPYEPYVMRCMHKGMTPTEIDRSKHWQRGTTRMILSERWAREKNEQVENIRRNR